MSRATDAARALRDRRGGRVVFVSHCLLNENTRYLGGACRAGCVGEIVDQCVRHGLGIVQLPCPEERAWGGVLKRRLYAGLALGPRLVRWARVAGAPLTRVIYRRLARRAAAQIADYRRSGMSVVAIVGVDGSPSCGVHTTVAPECLEELARAAPTVEAHNAAVRRHAVAGRGMFIAALEDELARRGLTVPLLAHDLLAELDGAPSGVKLS